MGSDESEPTKKIGVGWGWYILIALMAQFVKPMRFSHALAIALECIIFCLIIYFYFKKREAIYLKENTLPNFKLSHASFRVGFYSMLLFLGSLFAVSIIDRLVNRF